MTRFMRMLAPVLLAATQMGGCEGNVNEGSGFPSSLTFRISVSSDNVEGNGPSSAIADAEGSGPTGLTTKLAISRDGRYVAFTSDSTNLHPNATNGFTHVYVRDTVTNTTILISVSTAGVTGNGNSDDPSISDDGNLVAFSSQATNLHADDGNVDVDIYVRNIATATTSLESRLTGAAGAKALAGSSSRKPALSGNGAFVVFQCNATNFLASGITNVFRRELSGAFNTILVSAQDGTAAAEGNNESFNASVSLDGDRVAFESEASDLDAVDADDPDATRDIYVRVVSTNATKLLSRPSGAATSASKSGGSSRPAISANGRFVAFESSATDLVIGDVNGTVDIFVRGDIDLAVAAQTTERVSVSSAGGEAAVGFVFFTVAQARPSISEDGNLVAFESIAANLVVNDNNQTHDIFVRNRSAGTTERVSVRTLGTEGNGRSGQSMISADGRFVAFGSFASNLVEQDNNGSPDVFVRQRS